MRCASFQMTDPNVAGGDSVRETSNASRHALVTEEDFQIRQNIVAGGNSTALASLAGNSELEWSEEQIVAPHNAVVV